MLVVPLFKSCYRAAWILVDPDDYDWAMQFLWRDNGCGYAVRYEEGKTRLMHRELMNLFPGDGLEVDHIDRDRLNNCRSNLRLATRSQQARNQRARNPTGIRGVQQTPKGRWRAQGKIDGRVTYLGTYDHREDAIAARSEWERESGFAS